MRGLSKRGEVGISPILRGGLAQPGHGSKRRLDFGWLTQETDAFIPQPIIARFPGLFLGEDVVPAHDRLGRQQAQQAKLRESAEKQASGTANGLEPTPGTDMVDVSFVGESDPDVDIREKK